MPCQSTSGCSISRFEVIAGDSTKNNRHIDVLFAKFARQVYSNPTMSMTPT